MSGVAEGGSAAGSAHDLAEWVCATIELREQADYLRTVNHG